ncbi:MAG: flagellar biosynthesis protein FlhF [Desulfobulbus sp.]|nr:flagellar biosynthesis protein FlhF [Desulfobulbus sp.]
MQVKVFEAKDMATGLKMVKEALGPDALILSTRTIRSGKFGMLGKPMMEITAAVDNGWQEPKSAPQPRQDQSLQQYSPQQERQFQPRQYSQAQEEITYEEIWNKNRSDIPHTRSTSAVRSAADFRESNPENQDIHRELAELRNMVKGLSNRIAAPEAVPQRKAYVEPEFTAPAATGAADPIVSLLTGYGLNQETAQVVARFSRDTLDQAEQLSHADLSRILKSTIARLFTTQPLFTEETNSQRRISLIGPTGVGKTTTLAKIAAHYLSQYGGRIGLITIDTYRIAAIEQLKVYCEIMRLPLEVVIKPQELEQALDKFQDFDLILIDTAGRSPRSGVDIQELAAFLKPRLKIENNLMLSATTREREVEETIRRFSLLPINNFIFSKIDECDQLGVLLNIHYKNDTPISFLTNGQRVPEDLLMPTPQDIADLIINDHGYPTHG